MARWPMSVRWTRTVDVDAAQRLVGTLLRGLDLLAQGGDAQHAPAAGEQLAVLSRRAGVEHLQVFGRVLAAR